MQWAYYARTVRGTALVERAQGICRGGDLPGPFRRRIIFRHLLPNCLPPLIVVGTVQVANAIALEATCLPRRRPAADRTVAWAC